MAELTMYKRTLTSPSPTVALANSREKRQSKQTIGDQKTTRGRALAINLSVTLRLGSSYKEQRVERELLRADGSSFPGDISREERVSVLSAGHGPCLAQPAA